MVYMTYYFTPRIRIIIGKRIKKVRKVKNLKQVEVAVDAGLNPSYYGKIERGLVNSSLEKFYRILKALNIKSKEILPF
ncbi:MAG: methyltransferase protein [Candidatus Roizmanbacteria bacterium GW2011_GWA2_32_13]|uniref:Methyltransferase protein n=1 Tax=Candidatus Roizmanbacteria bacterium GW2011_GWA2_32_13 TaxID=1618475 RepID=A0A0F9YPS6_9BACT|nr:MAG: methyltransferase protein [Candidatus Roizmanbacteria bacterium GW2011_GWA2_32_13]